MAVVAASLAVVAAFVGVVLATGSSGDPLAVYSARSHYGEERPFKDFAARTGEDITLFGGSASELFERIKAEGNRTDADVLITVDAANLWRAKEAGLLRPVRSAALERDVPGDVRDRDGYWFGLTVRARTAMRSTKRVPPNALATYEDLGDPRWKGKLCLRSGTSEYNVSFVADRLAKDGRAKTERMLRSWMANDPDILGSDTDVLEAIADGKCDVGLTNSYYLGREKEEDPGFPVAAVWLDQQGRGTHVNLSGIAVVKDGQRADAATRLLEFLASPAQQRALAANNHELPIKADGRFKRDPIDVDGAGTRLDDAVKLMNEVGWE